MVALSSTSIAAPRALASDQARRLAEMLWEDERLKGKVSAGLYVGGNGQHGAADADHLEALFDQDDEPVDGVLLAEVVVIQSAQQLATQRPAQVQGAGNNRPAPDRVR